MNNQNKTVIVVFSHTAGLAVIRALGQMGIPIVVLHYRPVEFGYLSKYVKNHFRIADPDINEESFIADILSLADRYPGALLVPTDDFSVVALSKNKNRLESYFLVAVQDWSLVQRLIEKQHTYELAEQLKIPYPRTELCETLDDINQKSGNLRFPCLLKPCQGHQFFDLFRKKVIVVQDGAELRGRFLEFQSLKIKVMVQEIIPGEACEGVNYNSYIADGAPIAEFTAEKVRIDPPFFGSPRVIVSKKIPQIIEPGRKLLRALGYQGFSCMEFKRDVRDGVYRLLEVNPRHNLSGSLAVACGINFPWIMYRDLVDKKKEFRTDFLENIYWIDLTKDVMRFFISRKEEGYSIREYIKPYLSKKVYAILGARDPLPFLKRCLYPFRKRGKT
jgi:predicted ATP-grasp superfamily ATP-dependent carboligase